MKRRNSASIAAVICCAIVGASGLWSLLTGRIAMKGYKIEGADARIAGALLAIGATWALVSARRRGKDSAR